MGHRSLRTMEFYHPPSDKLLLGYKSTPAQSSLALGRLRITPFPFCLIASPRTALLGQLIGDHKELNKEGTRSAC